MNKIDYQVLREKAEKATCGEWSLEYGEERFDAGDALIHREVVGYLPICRIEGAHPESGFDEDFQMEQQANAEFIAAANPATVLALLGELEAAKKRIAELEAEPVSQTCKLNEPSGNSPVTPDGWISCSERMPDREYVLAGDFSGTHYLASIPNVQVGIYADWFDDEKPCWDDGDGNDLHLKEVTHWMPLPAPQQEVK
ncbi:TPA: ead/Ea22-like family protein [Salmonella enterica subsp. enterica serovar Agona]|nr:ead/Ea22-like family protein [Salmonella enterica subsp. enterica serovar Agona]